MKAFYFFLCLSFLSCGKVKQIDTSDIKELMRNSKVKRVTEKQLLEKVSEIGEAVNSRINRADYRVECQHSYEIDGYPVELYNADLAGEDPMDDVKGQLLEAYQYGIRNGQHVGSNIQKLNDTLYAYSFPLGRESYLKTACNQDFALVIISGPKVIRQL